MRRSITLFILSLGMALFGCATEMQEESAVDDAAEAELVKGEVLPLEGGALSAFVGDSESPSANCSVVQYCDAPGKEGSVCKQLGCSTTAALTECFNEVRNVCGTHTCPLIFVDLNGRRINQCATGCGINSKALIPCSAPVDPATTSAL